MSDHEDTDGVRQGYVLGLSASEGMDYLVSRPMFDRWLESVKDEAFDDGFYAGSELGYTPERKGDTMSYARFGWDGSDVYVFMHVSGHLECCACILAHGDWESFLAGGYTNNG